jgi:hypothetical protein
VNVAPVHPPEEQHARPRWHAWRVPILLFLIVAGFYWKLTLTREFEWIWGPDLAIQVLPWLEEEARQVHAGSIPLWDPHDWLGQPMLGQAQPGTAYPLNWILFAIPEKRGHLRQETIQWYFIAIHFMAALFCYLLCRDLGRSPAASVIAGLVFSLSSYVGTTDWPQMVNGAVWAPLIFLFLLRAGRGVRPLASAALSGLFWGMSWLSGHHQVPIFLSLAAGGTWLYYALRSGRLDWSVVRNAAVAVIVMGLTGAVQILPANEYGHLAKRWAGTPDPLTWNQVVPYWVHAQYGLFPISLFAIVFPGWNRNADPFIGFVALVLMMLALALCWRQHAVKLFFALAIGGIVFSLGQHAVFQGFLYAVVPMVDKARVPSMAVVVWGFGAAVLAAFGVDHFASEGSISPWGRRFAIGSAAFGFILYALILNALFQKKQGWDIDDRVVLTGFIALLLGALLYAWRSGNLHRRQAVTLLAMLLLLELGNDSGYAFSDRSSKEREQYIEQVRADPDIAAFLDGKKRASAGMPFRIDIQTDQLASNWAAYHDFDTAKAMGASVTINVLETEWHTWNSRMLFGERYDIAEKPERPEQREVFTAANGLKVYENPDAFPRAWIVHELAPMQDSRYSRVFVSEHLADLHAKATVTGVQPRVAACDASKDSVSYLRYGAESSVLRANLACDGLLVISDSYYPGWVAAVDGKSTPIEPVDIALRGIAVPAGSHEIVMRFHPRSVYLGTVLTLTGVLGALALARYGPERRVRS